jgi:hypothetical protein
MSPFLTSVTSSARPTHLPRPIEAESCTQQWWNSGARHNTAELDALVEKLHQVSEYLGDEVVIVGVQQTDPQSHPGFAVLTDVQKSGLGDVLKAVSAPSIRVVRRGCHSAPLQLRHQVRRGVALSSGNMKQSSPTASPC